MKKLLVAFMLFLAIGSVQADEKEEEQFKHRFAVVWNFVTPDRDLINNNLSKQAKQTLDLWKEGVIENVYMNQNAKFSDQKEINNIMFFIKADTREDAAKVLDEMLFVKEKIADYQLFPVGLLWLKTAGDEPLEQPKE